jgi:hypothetical protein
MSVLPQAWEKFEDTKGVITKPYISKDRQYNGQKKKEKQQSTKHYIEN